MPDITVVEKIPGAEEYIRLRQAVGWGTHEPSAIEECLRNSLYCICAFADGELVGMARIVGDGGLVFYIQDVIVAPAHQRQGIGTQLMDKVMAYIQAHAHQNAVIGLMAAKGKEPFYERYGFIRRPTDKLGSGMTIFWQIRSSE